MWGANFGTTASAGHWGQKMLEGVHSASAGAQHGQIVPLIMRWPHRNAENQRAALRHSVWHRGCSGASMCHSCALLRHMSAKRMLAPEHSCMLPMGLAPEHNRPGSRACAPEHSQQSTANREKN